MSKILLVEDDADILDLTAYVLRRERYIVIEARDGAQALRRWKTDRPDIIVLDLGLPSLDGFEVLRQIREEEEETPILVLTGRRDAKDLLRCFNLGTDDFLPKPFEFRELVARMRAILRRARVSAQGEAEPRLEIDGLLPKPFEFRELSVRIRAILRRAGKRHREEAEPRVQVEGLNLDPETYEVSWRGQSVRLTPTEFRILYLLATNAGHVVPASRLYTYVWGSEGGDANALRSHISHIRRKLEIDGSGPGKITSVPAVGYVLRPEAPSVPAAPAARVPAPEPTPLPIARPSLPAARLAPATVMLATSEATASSD